MDNSFEAQVQARLGVQDPVDTLRQMITFQQNSVAGVLTELVEWSEWSQFMKEWYPDADCIDIEVETEYDGDASFQRVVSIVPNYGTEIDDTRPRYDVYVDHLASIRTPSYSKRIVRDLPPKPVYLLKRLDDFIATTEAVLRQLARVHAHAE